MSEYHVHPSRQGHDALADAIDLCRRVAKRHETLSRVHHHAPVDRPPVPGRSGEALCGYVRVARTEEQALGLPCCPMCASVMEDNGNHCPSWKDAG